MSTRVIRSDDDSVEKLFSLFIDDERVKNVEIKFAYLYENLLNFKAKNVSLSGESGNNEEEIAN